MKNNYESKEGREGDKKLKALKKENFQLRIIINELQQKLVVYRAREVADYMRSLDYNDKEAHAALAMLKKHTKKNSNK